jgi:sugar/nucleoside kinase (ribokinase family)
MKAIVLKEGAIGSSWWSKTANDNLDVVFAPAHKDTKGDLKVVDTTGAGDCFTGAFAVRYAECKNVFDSLCFANFSAYLCVTKVGAQNSPTRQEVEKLMKENPICSKAAAEEYE